MHSLSQELKDGGAAEVAVHAPTGPVADRQHAEHGWVSNGIPAAARLVGHRLRRHQCGAWKCAPPQVYDIGASAPV